jgi:hypothetical protein
MEPHQLIRKIDDRILYKVTEGLSLGEVIAYLEVIAYFQETADSCQSKETFMQVRLKYLITNWKLIDPNKRMNTLYVIFINKRLKDLKWLNLTHCKFGTDGINEIFCSKYLRSLEILIVKDNKITEIEGPFTDL